MSCVMFSLENFYDITSNNKPYLLEPSFYALIDDIDTKVKPIFIERQDRKHDNHRSKRVTTSQKEDNADWQQIRNSFKPTTIDKSTEGIDKWIRDIRVCVNKMSANNYDSQKDIILSLLEKCLEDEESKEENLKKIAGFIFSVASNNRFFVELYVSLYKELMGKYDIFKDLLQDYLSSYVSSIKTIKYVDPNVNYEEYCMYNKQNDLRKANAMFIVCLVKMDVLPVMRALTIVSSFQELSNEYIEQDGRTNEIEEIAELLFIFLKEGKGIFTDYKGEWIWKFVIVPNLEKITKMKKGEKPSITQRAIFKYMDIMEGL